MDTLFLIVGLGNPGLKYTRTRHNAGFLVAEHLAQRWAVLVQPESRFEARVGRFDWQGRSGWLVLPQTYMNASGVAVAALARFYRVPTERLLVVVDDADLPLGAMRLRPGGTSGGHHGLESVERALGTRHFARLRLGIGRREGAREITGHVLGRFAPEEWQQFAPVVERAGDAVECWLAEGIQTAMNRFNRVPTDPEQRQAV